MAGPPTGLSVVAQTNGHTELTWTNDGVYTSLSVWRRHPPVGYFKQDDLAVDDESYTDTESVESNELYVWKIVSNLGDSNEDSCTQWTATANDDMDMSDYKNVAVDFVLSGIDSMGMSEATEVVHDVYEEPPSEPQEYEVEETDIITMSDAYETTLSSGQNWMYYLGATLGKVYPYDKDYKGDADSDIVTYYQTKALDFADQYPQYMDTWKTIGKVYLDYLDLQECDVTVSISMDNGTTWINSFQTLGDGSLTVKTARFDFLITGRFFVIKLSHTSNDRLFQWVRLKVEFDPHKDWF